MATTLEKDPNGVRIVEVGSRDGLQNISARVSTPTKIELLSRLRQSGFRSIEVTSIVSPRAVPQLADCRDVLSHDFTRNLIRQSSTSPSSQLRLPVLVPNLKGLDLALQLGVREIAVFISASEGFSKANTNCTVDEGISRARQVAQAAISKGVAVRGYVSCIFADPYDGPTPPSAVLKAVRALLDAGCYEVSLGDTLGIGVAGQVRSLIRFLRSFDVPISRLAGHFHDTYGQALSNVWEAYQCGLRVFDSSVAGLGGCPFAPGAKGNVASEDVVYMFEQAGVHTGVDLSRLIQTGAWISSTLNIVNTSRAGTALLTKQRLNAQITSTTSQTKQPTSSSSKPSTPTRLRWAPLPSPTPDLLLHRSGRTLKITLNRPRNGNALTRSMIASLTSTFLTAPTQTSPKINRIVLAASGTRFFCTGMDLSASGTTVGKSQSPQSQSQSQPEEKSQYQILQTLFETISTCPLLTVSAVNGSCHGGGVGLAFACDLRLFCARANITLSEVRLGLAPATISKVIVREFGLAFAREAMITGRTIGAAELYARGVLSVPPVPLPLNSNSNSSAGTNDDSFSAALDAYIGTLRASAPAATALVKDLVDLGYRDPGGEEQARGIEKVFERMMVKGGEGDWGVREFQRRKRSKKGPVDWDEVDLEGEAKAKAKSKL